MKLKIKKTKIKENTAYAGVVTEIALDEERGWLRVYVELDDFPKAEVYKAMRYTDIHVEEVEEFFGELGLIDKNGVINTEDLEGERVVVTLKYSTGRHDWFVDDVLLERDFGEELTDEELPDDDEEDEFQLEEEDDEEEYSSRKKSSTRKTRK